MIYSNCDANALYAMESARLGGYMDENDKEDEFCPICGMFEPDYYYINDEGDCVGCCECVVRSDTQYGFPSL
ncbi:MAG: hypothetical protein IJT23_10375 [Clostridia bacterium]|nr:hypothetical protein [Clostridia bacterium]